FYREQSTFWVPQKANIFLLGGNFRDKKKALPKPTAEAMYNARLFYWDPGYFVDILCPDCHTKVEYWGYTRPRRVVDMHNCFYMIGRRHHCKQCKSKTGKHTVTFNSWDPRILKALPAQLLDEFPAYMSHRGAMAKPVFEMMRTVFHYGLGSKQFSNSLQWNVGTIDSTAIIQIAYKSWINIFQISHFKGKFPLALINFLSTGQIIKAGVITDARMGLADLCARILGKRLVKESTEQKGDPIRVSNNWERELLSQKQIQYAALDALASLQIYDRLARTEVPGKISATDLPGTQVSVHNIDGQLIAQGRISVDSTPIPGVPQVTPTRVRVTVSEVCIPAALVPLHNKQALGTFGTTPFDIVYAHSAPPEFDSGEANVDHDQAALEVAPNLLNDPEFSTWSLEIRSRVIMDIWHAMARVKVSKEHGLRRLFGIALRDAIFIPDEQDKARIEAYLKTQNLSWDHQLRFNARWFWRRCKRTVPPPDKLYEAVNEVYKLCGPQKDSKTNLPLFTPQAWHDAKNVLKAIRLGLLSDPPGVQLYYQMYIEKKTNLPIFRCARGTCIPEGAIHKNLKDQMPKSGTSIRHAAARIKDYVFIHNLVVGTLNRTGKMYKGHYNVEVYNRLQISLESARHLIPNAPILRGWVNGNLYVQGNETVGILALPENTRHMAGILPYNPLSDSKHKHAYLAQQQGTKYAVITVHSVEEKMEFTQMMQEFPGFNIPNSAPNFKDGARTWNSKANGDTIFYKVS
ncbi:hypothetical protein K438DRAFT_1522445, partial [Mycena galopus ATCC 62051]